MKEASPPRPERATSAAPRVVFFDFGGTLAYHHFGFHGPREAWQHVGRGFGLDLRADDLQAALDEAERAMGPRVYDYLGRTQEYWALFDGMVLRRLGIDTPPRAWESALSGIFQDPQRVHLFPETREVLEELRGRGYPLGVISNYHDDLPILLRHHGLERYFGSVTFSQEVGAEKPDARVFSFALKRASCEPGEALHVGDSWEADYLGATRAGLRALWLNRGTDPSPQAGPSVKDLRGVLSWLPSAP